MCVDTFYKCPDGNSDLYFELWFYFIYSTTAYTILDWIEITMMAHKDKTDNKDNNKTNNKKNNENNNNK